MSVSKTRKPHHHHHQPPPHKRPASLVTAPLAAALLLAMLGISIGYFTGGTLITALTGAGIGAIGGVLIGRLINRSIK